jgi:hypothetical protein
MQLFLVINKSFRKGPQGVYLRYHYSTSEVTRLEPQYQVSSTMLAKTVDFREFFDSLQQARVLTKIWTRQLEHTPLSTTLHHERTRYCGLW